MVISILPAGQLVCLFDRVPEGARSFYLEHYGPEDCHHGAALAWTTAPFADSVIGVFRYKLRGKRTMMGKGVWVAESARGQGVGQSLISRAMTHHACTTLRDYSTTPEGRSLLTKLQDYFRVIDGAMPR